jgi:hypothetical protein
VAGYCPLPKRHRVSRDQQKLKKQAEMNFFDKRIAYLLILNYAEVHKTIKEHQDATREFYE